MSPLYIFDLDGTLALCQHRQPLLDAGGPDRWRRFFAACVDDTVNYPVADTLLHILGSGCDVRIWSGRSDEVREQTEHWIRENLGVGPSDVELRMRAEGDYTPDHILKEQWLIQMDERDRLRLVAIFDDRDSVVEMWRKNGVACFQVAPGGF